MNKNMFLLGSVFLIILAVAMVALLNRGTSPSGSEDIRARAAVTKSLQLNGTVANIDESTGTIIVDNVYLADNSRVGEATSMGTWTVTAPPNFNMASIAPGQNVVMGIDSKTFLAQSRTVTALTIVPAQ